MSWTVECADLFRQQWPLVLRRVPTRNGLLNALAVSMHETSLSKGWYANGVAIPAWNFGAIQLRVPTEAERMALAAGSLKKGSFVPGGFLFGDSSPDTGGYWCVFAHDATPELGIARFLTILAKNRARVNVVIDGGSTYDVALAMYLTGYYENTHRGARPVALRSLPLNEGEALNVRDYASACEKARISLAVTLKDWSLDLDETPPSPYDGANDAAKNAEAGQWMPNLRDDDSEPGNA